MSSFGRTQTFSRLIIGVIILVFSVIVGANLYSSYHYKYRITVGHGDNSTTYYTNHIKRTDQCLEFESPGEDGVVEICGNYTLHQLH